MSLLISLEDAKRHLKFPTPAAPHPDDVTIESFIEAADEVIRFECDDVLPKTYNEQYDGGSPSIFLWHRPILDIQSVQESLGYITYELDYQQAGSAVTGSIFAYSIDNPDAGEITRRAGASVLVPFAPGDSNITVLYTAGRSPIPSNLLLAAKELVAHWYRNSQQRSGSSGAGAPNEMAFDAVMGANYSRDTESGQQNINIGVPDRILELIKGNRHFPIIA